MPHAQSSWTFTADDVLAEDGFEASATGQAPTCIIVNGSHVTLGEGDGGGVVTTVNTVEITEPYAIKGATFFQVAFEGGLQVLAGGGGPKPVELQVVRRIVTTSTQEAGCLTRTQVDTFEPYRREAARYSQQAAGGLLARPGVFVDADGVAFGQQTAYIDRYEELRLIHRVVTVRDYSGPLGEVETITSRTGRFFNPPSALSVFAGGIPSQLTVFTLGSGAGVQITEEEFFGGPDDPLIDAAFNQVALPTNPGIWLQVETTTIDHDTGFVLGRDEDLVTFALTGDGTFAYDEAGTVRSLHRNARGLVQSRKEVRNSAIAGEESAHQRITIESELERTSKVIVETVSSYLPAAEACSLDLKLRNSSQRVTALVCAGQEHRRNVVEIIDTPLIETPGEALVYARQRLRDLQATEIALRIPPNPTLRTSRAVIVDIPRLGFTKQPGWIHTISNEQAERGQGQGASPVTGSCIVRTSAF